MHFNLLDEPWLPCVTPDGKRVEVGIREALLRSPDFVGLRDPSPLATAALHRLLLAILHRAFGGPKDLDDWHDVWEAGVFDVERVGAYLDQWRGRFDLFDDDRPFYQIGGFELPKARPAAQLAQEAAGGNNPALFDHTVDDMPPAMPAAECARRLIANQAFALGGGVGPTSKMFGKHPNLTHAPLVGGVTVLLRGDNLFATLMLNLLTYNRDSPFESADGEDGPAWERDALPEPGPRVARGYLDLLTWQSRCVRLLPEDGGVRRMYYAQAESLDADSRPREPMWFYRLNKDGEAVPVRLNPGRALWRNSDSLFAFTKGDDPRHERRPLAFRQVARLRRHGLLRGLDLWRCSLLGLANDKAKAICWAHEDLPVPPELLEDEDLVNLLRVTLKKSESVGACLRASLDCLAQNLLKPAEPPNEWPQLSKQQKQDADQIRDSLQGMPRFWESLELPFKRFLCDLPRNPEQSVSQWLDQAKRLARRTLSEAASGAMGNDARELKARVVAERYMNRQLSMITLEPEGGDA